MFWSLPEQAWAEAVARQDQKARLIAELVRYPGASLSAVTAIVRVGELSSTRRVIEILS
jgi:hypothetical protein